MYILVGKRIEITKTKNVGFWHEDKLETISHRHLCKQNFLMSTKNKNTQRDHVTAHKSILYINEHFLSYLCILFVNNGKRYAQIIESVYATYEINKNIAIYMY